MTANSLSQRGMCQPPTKTAKESVLFAAASVKKRFIQLRHYSTFAPRGNNLMNVSRRDAKAVGRPVTGAVVG
ncbi:hypothetical protein FRC0433_01836 [Corynebacterium diphtheriae]|nr:hypothetical protein FRC0433_01836 [Corynebacterium diphtheriae]